VKLAVGETAVDIGPPHRRDPALHGGDAQPVRPAAGRETIAGENRGIVLEVGRRTALTSPGR
jgi:hypothetical protein